MMALASLVSLYTALVLFFPRVSPPFLIALRRVVPWAVAAHLGGGLSALALGPWQFNSRLRARTIKVHRWLGRGYVVAVVVGGIGALALAPMSQEGLVTHVGFGLLAVLWLLSTVQAYRHIRARDQESHRRWMIRSFALTLAAVTLRVYLPLALGVGVAFHDAYQVVAWLCWVPNLVVAEWVVLQGRSRPAKVTVDLA
jgi:uncharacterized membrane protein